MIDKERLRRYAEEYNIQLEQSAPDQFDNYAELLLEWNKRCNLTAITEPADIVVKHFLDSLMILNAVNIPEGASVIDVGTGAGFPGIPMHLVRKDLRLTLLDSLQKRVRFLMKVTGELGLNGHCIHGRAEELARRQDYRERYEIATARAVAALPALCEYCLPYVKVGGIFLAMKGFDVEAEVAHAEKAIAMLGGKVETIYKFELPMENRRAIVVIRKKSQTPAKYPRTAVKITKTTL